ncbi:probable potassium transporter 17 [Solanum dulcamara]|uniref:probable potassium transporter 17 n=1 Tax=Solanum dulcamara TaxID=45834 RepID=UPI0024869609|nr:probable potassium transporter 17 [Solanum dulcamara]
MDSPTGGVVSMVMLITTILLILVMIIIWRSPPALVALYFVVFVVMESVYVSATFTNIPEGDWTPFVISFILAFIMFGWFYGRPRKLEYELTHKIDLERIRPLLTDLGLRRVPGLCFFYTNIQDGLTPILGHYIKNMRSLHKVTVFTTLRYLLVPKVAPGERIVVSKLGLRGVYRCVIRYGYAVKFSLEGDDLVNQVIQCLRAHVLHCSNSLEVDDEVSELEEAKLAGVVHIRRKTRFYIGKRCGCFDRTMLVFYEVLHSNCRSALPSMGIPLPQRIEVGMLYEALHVLTALTTRDLWVFGFEILAPRGLWILGFEILAQRGLWILGFEILAPRGLWILGFEILAPRGLWILGFEILAQRGLWILGFEILV